MSIAGTIDAPLDIFGGLVTDMAAADVPQGVSPDCADVAFLQGAVKTRPGLAPVFAAIAGNPTVNYLKTYTQANQVQTLLALDSAGTLWSELAPGLLSPIAQNLVAGARPKSVTLFGREYLALGDGQFGADMPRQYDGTYFDRVSQCGPGAGPASAADVVANISAIARAGGVVTVTTATPHGLILSDRAVIAGVADASFNGTFAVASITDSTHFTYNQAGVDASSSGGTANPLGNIAAGIHQVAVIFVTRQGFLTPPSPPISWTAAGGRRATLTGIPLPLGVPNVVARILAFTAAGGASFYYTTGLNGAPQMQINDNTLTTFTVDFSDAQLLSGSLADDLFRLVELGECASVIDYAERLFWWGERNKMNNWTNLGFDGGWSGNVPLGWTADPTFGAGGARENVYVVWGAAYDIIGDGVTATRGLITQPAVTDANGAPRIRAATSYSVRARARAHGAVAQGTLHIHLYSASGGINTAGLQVSAAQLTANYAEFTGVLTAPLSSIPADLVLRVFADGTPTLSAGFTVDNIEIFPTAQPYNASLVRASGVEDPESYDAITGMLSVAENNGQAIRAAFKLRERLYFLKEHSFYATQDDGTSEPAEWTITEISRTIGTPSVHGVDVGEDWAVIAHRSGLYIYSGGEPVKISQEIQPTWDSINWQYGHTLWVRVDTRNKRILIGAPFGAATSPSRILVLDYRGLLDAGEIASLAPVHFSSFTGRLFAVGRARKWAPWNIAANSAGLIERADGTAQLFLGNGAGNGKIYQLSDTQFSDDGAPIASYYTTYFFLSQELEQEFRLPSHRKLFAYLTLYVEGAGNLSLTAFTSNQAFATAQQPLPLSAPATKDLELPINLPGERVAFQVGTNAVGAWFRLQRMVPSLLPDPWAPIRGLN